jgi:hypothetical protein
LMSLVKVQKYLGKSQLQRVAMVYAAFLNLLVFAYPQIKIFQ